MDDLIQAIAIIIIFGATIFSSLMNSWRERQKKLEEQNDFPIPQMPKQQPSRTSMPKPQQMPKPQPARTAQRPQQAVRPVKSQTQSTPKPGWDSTSRRPVYDSSPPLQGESKSSGQDMMRKIFKEIFDIDLPQMESEPIPRNNQDTATSLRSKPKPAAVKKTSYKSLPVPTEGGAIAAHDRVKIEISAKMASLHPVLLNLMKEGQTNPLRSAFIFSEILQPPVAMRKMKVPHLHC